MTTEEIGKLANFKTCFSKKTQFVHLNNAGLAPVSSVSVATAQIWLERFHEEGMHCNDAYMAAAETARAELAELAGAKPGQVAFFQSTAGAISQVAFGRSLNPGDEVLTWDQEYASNLYPWREACLRSNAKLVLAKSENNLSTPLDNLLAHVTERTRVIAVSWVQFQTGSVTDLQKLVQFAKPRNIWTVVDVIQGFGILPFHFENLGLDAICGGSHKWLVSPVGVGFLILRDELIPVLKPLTIGSSTYGNCDDPADLHCLPKRDALRFESGSKQVLEITALGASAKLVRETGVDVIRSEASRIANQLRQGLESLGFTLHSPRDAAPSFINFSHRRISNLKIVTDQLSKFRISHALRGPGVRLSTHAFNESSDVEITLKALSSLS